RDWIGRLALRLLWRRHLKWQLEVNLATRDAVHDLAAATERLTADLTGRAGVQELHAAVAAINAELDALRRQDQNLTAGLNQRLYSLVGGLRVELSDVRLHLADKTGRADEFAERLRALESAVTALSVAETNARLRNAQVDTLLDRAREPRTDHAPALDVAGVPDGGDFIELACAELLDGPVELARSARAGYLPLVDKARGNGATGTVLDMHPARGEWFEVLRTAEIGYRSASVNPLVVTTCAELGANVVLANPLSVLADTPKRTLGAVTAFRYAERLTPTELASFVNLAAMAIQPGGVLIVETPVMSWPAAKDFHLDPFARQPVHPSLLRFIAEAAGFSGIEIRYPDSGPLANWPAKLGAQAADKADRYCLVAWR
ncbi:MAG: hypothetical protein ACRDQB_18525, partial [Thermocrispum sp.]